MAGSSGQLQPIVVRWVLGIVGTICIALATLAYTSIKEDNQRLEVAILSLSSEIKGLTATIAVSQTVAEVNKANIAMLKENLNRHMENDK